MKKLLFLLLFFLIPTQVEAQPYRTAGKKPEWRVVSSVLQPRTISRDASIGNALSVNQYLYVGSQGVIRDNGGGDLEFSEDSGASFTDFGSGGASGNFTGLDLQGDSGGTFTLTNSDVIDIAGGTNISTVSADAGSTTTVTVNLDDDVVLAGSLSLAEDLTVQDDFIIPNGPTGTYHTMFVDYSTGNVGIGSSAPSARLFLDSHTDYNANTELHIRNNDANYDTVVFLQGTSGSEGIKWWYDNNTGKVYWDSVLDGYEHYWRDNNTDTMMTLHSGDLTPAGSVFISTVASPSGAVKIAVIDDTTGLIGKSQLDYPHADGAGSGSGEFTDEGSYLRPNEPLADSLSISVDVTIEGDVYAGPYTLSKSGNYTLTVNDMKRGAVLRCDADATITLPAVQEKMCATIKTIGDVSIFIDPNASDYIVLDGVVLDDGDKIGNLTESGNIAVIEYFSGDGWDATTDNWTDQS